MIEYLINILFFLTLILKDGTCAQLPRTTREFDPNKLMEQYMKLRTNIEQFGSFHPNDLISAIKEFQSHIQNSKELEKTKQQLTGKGFDPNGQSMFAGSQLSDWGFSYYNPNSAMEQYLRGNTATGSFGSHFTESGQSSNTGVISHSVKEGGFNADKLNNHLMSSFKENPFSTGFSAEGFKTNVVLSQEHIKSGVAGFNPDKLNYNLMSFLNKQKTPVLGENNIKQSGMENSGKKDNNTSYKFMEPTNYSFQTNSQSAFNPDTLNAQLIGSLGYDATAINKETSGPVSSSSSFMKKLNLTGNSLFLKQDSLTSDSAYGTLLHLLSGNQPGIESGRITGNHTIQNGYHAVTSGNNQQGTLHSPFSIQSNHGGIGTQTGLSGIPSSNQNGISQHVSSGTVQNHQASGAQVSPATVNTNANIQQTMGKEITQTGNTYISSIHMNQNSNQSANNYQTDASSKSTVHATGIGSIGIGLTGTTGGGQSFQNFGTETSGFHNLETSSQQGLPGLNGLPITQTQQIKQTGAENTGKVMATGIGSLGISGESGNPNLGNGYANGGQQYIASQTGSSNASTAQATGIGSLGTGNQHGSTDKNSLISHQGHVGDIIKQTISGNIKYVGASGIGGMGTSDHSNTNTGVGTSSAVVNQGGSFSGHHSNVVGIGGLGGESHFGNFGNLSGKEKSIKE